MSSADTARPARLLAGWAARAARRVHWYVTSLMGDRAYAVYAEHQRAAHPGQPVMGESVFWRERYATQERDPGASCC